MLNTEYTEYKYLIEKIIQEKIFTFNSNNIDNIDYYVENKILKLKYNDTYELEYNLEFLRELNNSFCASFNHNITTDFEQEYSFYKDLEEKFREDNFQGLYNITESIFVYLIIYFHNELNDDLSDFITFNISNSEHLDYKFIEAYGLSLIHLINEDKKKIFDNIVKLSRLISPDDGKTTRDFSLSKLQSDALYYCKKESVNANVFYSEYLNIFPLNEKPNFLVKILTGMYYSDNSGFYNKIDNLKNNSVFYSSIICSFANIDYEIIETCYLHNKIIEELNLYSGSTDSNTSNFYTHILEKNKERSFQLFAKEKIIETIINNAENLSYKIILANRLHYSDIDNVILREILVELINGSINENLIKQTDKVLERNGNIEFYFTFLIKIALGFNGFVSAKWIEFSLYKYVKHAEFSKYLISCLIHDIGRVRHLGLRIFMRLNIKEFTHFDIKELDAISQYKLWVSVLTTLNEPKEVLPALLPLLESKYPLVRATFIGKLETLIEEYKGSVIEVLKNNLNLSNLETLEVFNYLNNYCMEHIKELQAKDKVQELNPRYTQSKLYSFYMRYYSRGMSKEMGQQKNDEFSLTSLFKNITLVKGGGWRNKHHKQVSKLASISTSLQFPVSIYRMQDKLDFEISQEYNADWGTEEEIKKWELIIS